MKFFKLKNIFFSFLFFLCSSFPLTSLNSYAGGEEALSKAMAILQEVEKGNQHDLEYLWALLEPYCQNTSNHQFQTDKELWITQLHQDQETFKKLQILVGAGGTYALRSSLNKLIGIGNITGILQDSIQLLTEISQCESLKPHWESLQKHDLENHITVLKNTLLYANLKLETIQWSNAKDKLKIIYPDVFPASINSGLNSENTHSPLLCCPSESPSQIEILIPNRGYIFGGNFFENQCRGIDCSAFVSHCVECSQRLSTYHMELIWKSLYQNEVHEDPVVQQVKDEFLALSSEQTENILPGDLILWRNSSSHSGHVVLFKEWITPLAETPDQDLKFSGIEANRTDDKTHEGIQVREFTLKKELAKTYVLRRK